MHEHGKSLMPAPIQVSKYNAKTGKKIATYRSVNEAAYKTHYSANEIRMATVTGRPLDNHIWKIEGPK